MAFLITTTGAAGNVTLDDLGGRVLPNSLTNFDLESEFLIEEIRYSVSLASAIHNDAWVCSDDQGRSITAQGSLADTAELLRKAFHVIDTDDLPEGSSNLYHTTARARATLSIASASQTLLQYNNTTGEFSVKSLLITDTTVDVTHTSLASYVAQSPPPVHGEGDIVILTAATGGQETWIHNGGVADTVADYTIISTDFDDAAIKALFSGTLPINYNSITGVISLDLKADGGLVIESDELAVDLGASSITGTLAVGDGGTGTTTHSTGEVLLGAGTSAITSVARGDIVGAGSPSIISITGGAGAILGAGVTIDIIEANIDINALGGTPLSVTNGGTGLDASTVTAGQILIGNDTNNDFDLVTITAGDDIEIVNADGSITIGILDASITEEKLSISGSPSTGGANDILTSDGAGGFEWTSPTILGSLRSWTWDGAIRSVNATDRFFDREDGAPTNVTAFVAFFDCTIQAMSLSSGSASTWTAQVFKNGVLSTATLASGGSLTAVSGVLSVAVNAGDRISFKASGTMIDNPGLSVLFVEN